MGTAETPQLVRRHGSWFLCSRPGYLRIPRGHLCYLAPEIVLLLKPTPKGLNGFWRSRASDVYAFGCANTFEYCSKWDKVDDVWFVQNIVV